jgi:hypothetical protein
VKKDFFFFEQIVLFFTAFEDVTTQIEHTKLGLFCRTDHHAHDVTTGVIESDRPLVRL